MVNCVKSRETINYEAKKCVVLNKIITLIKQERNSDLCIKAGSRK